MKVIFLGTPKFAVNSLKTLFEATDINVLAVITQPNKPGNRNKIQIPPVKEFAESKGIKVFQPINISQDYSLLEELSSLQPDFLITVAYGQILKSNVLNLSKYGVINLHASLLPTYRGPAPLNWMLINGESILGFSTMLSDEGVDTGATLLKVTLDIDEEVIQNINSAELAELVSLEGAKLLLQTIQDFHIIQPHIQNGFDNLCDYQKLAPFMDKKLGEINFFSEKQRIWSANPRQSHYDFQRDNTAQNIHNLIRGLQPWPGAFFMYKNKKVIILRSSCVHLRIDDTVEQLTTNYGKRLPGQIVSVSRSEKYLDIFCFGGSLLRIFDLKISGGKGLITAFDFVNGERLKVGDLIC